jgi:hypothetical protein
MFTLPPIPRMGDSVGHSDSMVDGSSAVNTLPRCHFKKIPCLCLNPYCLTCSSNPAVQAAEEAQCAVPQS